MDIVDAQIHLFLTMDTAAGLAAMDALGIQAALIDEFWGYVGDEHTPPPGYTPAGAPFRPVAPGAEMASMRHPERFSYLLRIDRADPELDSLMRLLKAAPHGRALRLEVRTEEEVRAFKAGECNTFFAAAQRHGLPVFILSLPGNVSLLTPYVEAFPDLLFIIDHCGMPKDLANFDEVLRLGSYANTALKWCHAPRFFNITEYPFNALSPHLGRARDAFGRERIMWASDFTAIRSGHSWAESLFYLRHNPSLSESDKAWILGGTVRKLLAWPAPEAPSKPALHRH
ncbi:MAG: amidohydrolase family protein [Janthinobacterium lividum]